MVNLVKFQTYWIKKPYKRGKRVYKYRGILLKFPRKSHEKIEPHLKKEFEIKEINAHETADEEIIHIILSRDKRTEQACD